MLIKGRLQGLQSNDLGEAMTLLQGLRSIHPEQDCEIFIDNTGVVDTWDKDTLNNPRARLHSTGRALWNRIQLLKKARQRAGARTRVQWVHSHVDDPARQQVKSTSRHKCARQGANMKCLPSHPHHKGNEAAGRLATEGLEGEVHHRG